jgi:hypothetical protein
LAKPAGSEIPRRDVWLEDKPGACKNIEDKFELAPRTLFMGRLFREFELAFAPRTLERDLFRAHILLRPALGHDDSSYLSSWFGWSGASDAGDFDFFENNQFLTPKSKGALGTKLLYQHASAVHPLFSSFGCSANNRMVKSFWNPIP